MTEDQQKFFEMLEPFSRFKHHWNQINRTLDVDGFNQDLRLMSSGERHIAKFLASVWFGETDSYPFDLIDSTRVLNFENRKVIVKWLAAPFFP